MKHRRWKICGTVCEVPEEMYEILWKSVCFPPLLKPKNSVWVLKEPIYRPQRDPAEPVPHSHIYLKVHFNIIVPSTRSYQEVVSSFNEFRPNFVFIFKSRLHDAFPIVLKLSYSVYWNMLLVKELKRS